MSQENVEVARTVVEAFNAGNWDRYFAQLDPDVEWWDRGDEPHATVHRGHEGVHAFLADLAETAEFGVQATEFVDSRAGGCLPARPWSRKDQRRRVR